MPVRRTANYTVDTFVVQLPESVHHLCGDDADVAIGNGWLLLLALFFGAVQGLSDGSLNPHVGSESALSGSPSDLVSLRGVEPGIDGLIRRPRRGWCFVGHSLQKGGSSDSEGGSEGCHGPPDHLLPEGSGSEPVSHASLGPLAFRPLAIALWPLRRSMPWTA